MRFSIVLRFARVLMISRLRSTRRSFVPKSLLSRPGLIIVIGVGLFLAALLAGIVTVAFLRLGFGAVPTPESQTLATTLLAGAPVFLTGFYFTMGLLWELNASVEVESTDAINWLPISPGEYVAASSLSTSYTYSPALMIAFGYSLPVALFTDNLPTFISLIPVAILASLIGSVGVEILRSSLSRASSAFSRMGGRIVIALRIMGILLVLISTQLLFSGFLIAGIIGSLVSGSSSLSFVPVFWPTLAITSALASNLLGTIFYFLTGTGFLLLLVGAAIYLKSKYWVIPPSSIHMSKAGSISGPTRFGFWGLGQVGLALLRREIRSATRRKEVVRLVVIPVIIPVMIGFPLVFSPTPPPTNGASGQIASVILGAPFLFGVGVGALFLSMTSIGQEGKTIWSLCSLPVTAKMLVGTKILFSALVSAIGLLLGAAVTTVLFHMALASFAVFLGLGSSVIVAEVGIGLAIGSRFPDFSEGPRPRFVSISGSIIGAVVGLVGLGLMLSPVVVSVILQVLYGIPAILPVGILLSGTVGFLIGWLGYRVSIRQVEKILREFPA